MGFFKCLIKGFNCDKKIFNLRGVKYKKMTIAGIKSLLRAEMKKVDVVVSGPLLTFDTQYLAYPKKTIEKVSRMFPDVVNHTAFLKGKIDEPTEGSDCDNIAEHHSYYFHSVLPASCCINATQPGHRFMGVVTMEGGIVWFNANPASNDEIYNIYF